MDVREASREYAVDSMAAGFATRLWNMWRISDDFWDAWPQLLSQFKRLHDWTPHRITGAWPDADMLPLGIIKFNKRTGFTPNE